jgi:hypothetical protein
LPNEQRHFGPLQFDHLGDYIYALRDPRTHRSFYVGKGVGDRAFHHFNETEAAIATGQALSPKQHTIAAIWGEERDVDVVILRRHLERELTGFDVEAAVMDALAKSSNGAPDNDQAGHHVVERGAIELDQLAALAAPAVDPPNAYPVVLVFQIHNALRGGAGVYDATRQAWRVGADLRETKNAIAVGVKDGVSEGVFGVHEWQAAQGAAGKWEFLGESLEDPNLLRRNWLAVLNAAIGYLKYGGGYVAIEMDGNHMFRFLRGHADHVTWFNLL